MHEMSVAMGIVEIAVNHMSKAGASRVIQVRAAVGELSGVMPEAVEFCYEAACKGTAAEGSGLLIDKVAARAQCQACLRDFVPEYPLAVCPACGALGGRIISGEELYVDDITVE